MGACYSEAMTDSEKEKHVNMQLENRVLAVLQQGGQKFPEGQGGKYLHWQGLAKSSQGSQGSSGNQMVRPTSQ